MEIGSKLKNARMKIEMTQEYVAEQIGVSRQTISNWETGKSYPDIVSVIKMSDLYDVSLDYLLKGKEAATMANYMNYLEESTNMVKSKQRFSKLIQIGIYVVLWTACLIWFWLGRSNDPTFAPAFAIMTFYLILPITTFVLSILIGRDESWGKYRWVMIFFFGAMFSLEIFGTFSTANSLYNDFAYYRYPKLYDTLPGIIISSIGMLIGWIAKLYREFKEKLNYLREEEKYNDVSMKTFDMDMNKEIFEKYESKESTVDIMEPLSELDDRKIQLILKEINNTTLIYALAGASGKVCIKFMRNLSGRMLRFVDEKLQEDKFETEKIRAAQIDILQVAAVVGK